jgi:hypothetical protein
MMVSANTAHSNPARVISTHGCAHICATITTNTAAICARVFSFPHRLGRKSRSEVVA